MLIHPSVCGRYFMSSRSSTLVCWPQLLRPIWKFSGLWSLAHRSFCWAYVMSFRNHRLSLETSQLLATYATCWKKSVQNSTNILWNPTQEVVPSTVWNEASSISVPKMHETLSLSELNKMFTKLATSGSTTRSSLLTWIRLIFVSH